MSAGRARWPENKTFAFTIFDDPDSQTLEAGREVYALLSDLGFRTTKAVWPVRGNGDILQTPAGQKKRLALLARRAVDEIERFDQFHRGGNQSKRAWQNDCTDGAPQSFWGANGLPEVGQGARPQAG